MLIASKNGRKIRAMVMNTPVDRCLGVVQCGLAGCEAWMPLTVELGNADSAKEQVAWFLDHHECRAPGQRKASTKKRAV
jgi:hypothetical protein